MFDEHSDRWNYIDGITSCSTYYDKSNQSICVDMLEDKQMVLAIHDEAYLLNDLGKTIERIHC